MEIVKLLMLPPDNRIVEVSIRTFNNRFYVYKNVGNAFYIHGFANLHEASFLWKSITEKNFRLNVQPDIFITEFENERYTDFVEYLN